MRVKLVGNDTNVDLSPFQLVVGGLSTTVHLSSRKDEAVLIRMCRKSYLIFVMSCVQLQSLMILDPTGGTGREWCIL